MRGEFFKDMKGRHEERRDSRSRQQLTIEEEKDTIDICGHVRVECSIQATRIGITASVSSSSSTKMCQNCCFHSSCLRCLFTNDEFHESRLEILERKSKNEDS